MTYLTFLKNSFSNWFLVDFLIFIILYYILYMILLTYTEYIYFVSISLIFFLISLLGWWGFTLSFIILLILYSSLVVIFWSFYVSFTDFKKKKEKLRENSPILLIFIFILPLKNTSSDTYIPNFLKDLFFIDFFSLEDYSEFFILYFLIYIMNQVTTLFIFLTLVFTCFNIIEVLLLKQSVVVTRSLSLSTSLDFLKYTRRSVSNRTNFWSSLSSQLSQNQLYKSL